MAKWLFVMTALIAVLAGCRTSNKHTPAGKELSYEAMRDDLHIFKDLLQQGDPTLNSYISEERFNRMYDSIYAGLPEYADIYDFYKKLNSVVNEICCSHTDVLLPDAVYDSLGPMKAFFPYPVQLIEDRLLVNVTGQELPQGTEIEKVNGRKVKDLLKEMMFYNTIDGHHRKAQMQSAAEKFSFEYFLQYGQTNTFNLTIIDTTGTRKDVRQDAVSFDEWNQRNDRYKYYYDNTDVDFDFYISEELKYAYMRIPTFDFDGAAKENAWEHFCSNSFELLHRKPGIHNLIIDIRENEGGRLRAVFNLYSYLAKKPFKEYDNVYSRVNRLPFAKYLGKDFYTDEMDGINQELKESFVSRGDGYFYSDSLINTWYPDPYAFRGNVFVVTNHNVNSAASYLATLVQQSGVGKVVGQETAGSSYSSGGFRQVEYVLPNSGIKLYYSFARLLYSTREPKNSGHGVLPDYDIGDSYQSFKDNKDNQIKFIIDSLIN